MKSGWMLVAATGCLLLSAAAFAELTPGQKMAAEALIKQFTAADFDQRQKAVDRLIEMGKDVVPVVKKAMADTQDNEVKMRCEMVLKKLGAVEPAPTPKKVAEQKFGNDASKVTVHAKDVEIDTVLQSLAEQSGNTRLEAPKDWEGKAVSLDVSDVPYWEAVNRLCADQKLVVISDPMQGGVLKLVPAKDAAPPAACSGPADVRIDSITLTKQYVGPAVNFMGATPAMSISLTYLYEDRLRPLDVEANVTKVAATEDKELVLNNKDNNNPMGMLAGAMVVMMGGGDQKTCSGTFSAAVNEVPANVRALKSVEGVVKMTFGKGEREFKIENAAVGKSVTIGKEKVTIGQYKMQGGSASVTVRHEVDGKEVEDKLGGSQGYGIVLVDPKGNRHAETAAGPGGAWNMVLGGPAVIRRDVKFQVGGAGPAPGGMVVGGNLVNAGGITAQFQGLPDIDGQWTVILVLPESTTVKECPFKLANVQLP